MRDIGYNFQGNNYTEHGLGPWSQCFSGSNWMRASNYSPLIKAEDDKALAEYVRFVENSTLEKVPHPSLYFDVQNQGMTKWLNDRGVEGKDISLLKFEVEDLIRILENDPVTIGTYKMAGLPGGHMILLVDYDIRMNAFKVNDPAGDARTNYKDRNGHGVLYPVSFLLPFIVQGNEYCRIQCWQS